MHSSSQLIVPVTAGSLAAWDAGEGEPVLLISGLGGRAAFWTDIAPRLANEFRVITHDHRGTGASSPDKIDYSISQMADDVIQLMDASQIERASLVGHSTGGAIAQHLALHHPGRLKSIVLSATWAGPTQYFLNLFEQRRAILSQLGPKAYLADGILRAHPPSYFNSNAAKIYANETDRLRQFPDKAIELSRIDAVMAHDLRERISGIDLPTLIVSADDDQIVPPYYADELAERVPDAAKHRFEQGGHFFPQIHPIEFVRIIANFLKGN
ncbi:MAG: alpha/beta hydrolase [Erythrobacter sp.]|uniref:alpha/beta fold hydrolase n=1 Tax=Erythrobacter sp. TaxID=1042 RepID=UPI0032640461